MKIPTVLAMANATERKLYFDNNRVEDLLREYVWTRCTRVVLRDQIMTHAGELIRQIIMAHKLHKIYPGQEESAFGDLFQTAWCQLERVLYKYRARPHCASCYNAIRPQDSMLYNPPDDEYGIIRPEEVVIRQLACPTCKKIPASLVYRGTSKVFNLWSQIARTVILAYIKKESRDYKNQGAYQNHLEYKSDPNSGVMGRFMDEANHICKHNKTHMAILDALKRIMVTDDKPHEGIIGKLVRDSNQSRAQVASFLKMVRLRSDEFSDSPINERSKRRPTSRVNWTEQD